MEQPPSPIPAPSSPPSSPPLSTLPPPPRLARIALFAFEGTGHVNPMAALGAALSSRGHHVTFVHLLDMEAKVRAAQLHSLPYATDELPLGSIQRFNDEMGQLSGIPSLRYQVRRAQDGVRLQLRDLPPLLRSHGPFDVLLVDSAQLAPHLVGEHLGIPTVTVDLLPPCFFESSAPPWIFGWRYSDAWWARARNWLGNRIFLLSLAPLRGILDAQRTAWGLPPQPDPSELWSTRLRISHMPGLLDFPRRSWPPHFHHCGPFISAEAREKVAFPWERLTGQRLVYASLGTLNNSDVRVWKAIAEGVEGLGVQLVLSTGGGMEPAALGLDGGAASTLVVVRMAPQMELIERSALVVTHGGINSVMEALLAGRPLVVIPIASDQPGNGARVERLGLGEVVEKEGVTGAKLRATVRRVLEDEGYARRAVEMQAKLRAERGTEKAVGLIEGLLSQPAVTADG